MSKPFTIMDVKFYPKDECAEAKRKLSRYNYECMSIINENKIGSMNFLYDKYKPKNQEEFFDIWTNVSLKGDDLPNAERGRDLDYLYDLASEYQLKCDREIPTIYYWKDILMHAIYQTWDGRKREEEITGILKKLGYEIKHSGYKEDSKLNLDLIAYKDGKCAFLIQIKPISTFMNNANWALTTRKKFFKMQEKGMKKYGAPYVYLIYNSHYDTDVKWVYNDEKEKFLFSLNDLCNEDGTLKKGVNLSKNKEFEKITI